MYHETFGCDPGTNGCLAVARGGQKTNPTVDHVRFQGKTIAELRYEIMNIQRRGDSSGVKGGSIIQHGRKCYMELVGYQQQDSAPNNAKKLPNKFKMMKAAGAIEGALMMLGIEIEYVRHWHLEFGLGGIQDYEDRKKAAHVVAKEIFGDHITKDAADGCLITLYGWRKENGFLTSGRREGFISKPGRGIIDDRLSDLE